MPHVIILNATIYEWNRVSSSSDRMKEWTFAKDDLGKLPARSGRGYYVEYTDSPHSNASVEYELVGTGHRFGIHAQKVQRGAPNNYRPVIHVTFNFSRLGDSGGDWLEWRSDSAAITFLLGGKEGAFYCNPTPHDWMHQTLPTIGHRNLMQVCIPGSHDAGMSQAWTKAVTGFCKLRHVVTQYDSMLEQLKSGCRWFDIRPWIVSGQLTTGHYSPLGGFLGWQGGTGQSIRSIVDDVNTFTATNKELVVLYMGHAHNADQDYRQFNQHDWDTVFQETDRLNNLYKVDVKDLTLVTINEFIKDGAAVLVVVDRGNDISLGDKPWTRERSVSLDPTFLPGLRRMWGRKRTVDDEVGLLGAEHGGCNQGLPRRWMVSGGVGRIQTARLFHG
ncbi:PLC-like phosphodiesterase [Mycena galopus ATCC 62051]|nr:PLC-like phosphodiesterase [Mycena galopus ATCC 62051]